METLEKRRAIRQECMVPIACKKGTMFDNSQTTDISKGGVGLISDKFIPVHTKMIVQIELTPKGEPVLALGQVRWVSHLPHSEGYRVGMAFSEFSTGSQPRLANYFSK